MKPSDISSEAWNAAEVEASVYLVWLGPDATKHESDAHHVLTYSIARAIDAATAKATERAALKAADALHDWSADLYATFESYVEAKTTGKHSGRRISREACSLYASQFRERSEAVAGCVDIVTDAIRQGSQPSNAIPHRGTVKS